MGVVSIAMENLPPGALDSLSKAVSASLERDRAERKGREDATNEAEELMRSLRTDFGLAKQALRDIDGLSDEDYRDHGEDGLVESIESREKQYLDLHTALVTIFRQGMRDLDEGELTEAIRPLLEAVRELANLVADTHEAWQAVKWRLIETGTQFGPVNPVGGIQGKPS